MISEIGYVSLVESAGKMYSDYCMALEALGMIQGDEDHIMDFIDTVLTVAAEEAGDRNFIDVIIRAGDDIKVDHPNYWEADMPLTFHFAWNLMFGDGARDGTYTTISIEGTKYELASAREVYACLSHLHQLRAHYGIE